MGDGEEGPCGCFPAGLQCVLSGATLGACLSSGALGRGQCGQGCQLLQGDPECTDTHTHTPHTNTTHTHNTRTHTHQHNTHTQTHHTHTTHTHHTHHTHTPHTPHTHTPHTPHTHTTHTQRTLNKGCWVVATTWGGWRSSPQECHQLVDLVEWRHSQRTASIQPAGRQAVRA